MTCRPDHVKLAVRALLLGYFLSKAFETFEWNPGPTFVGGHPAGLHVGIVLDLHAHDSVPASGGGSRVHKECPREDRLQNEYGRSSCVFGRLSCRPNGLKRSKPSTNRFGLNGSVCETQRLPALEKLLVPLSSRENFADPFYQGYFERDVRTPGWEPVSVNYVA